MDYKSCEHTSTWKCPDCDGVAIFNKETAEDEFGNTILVVECSCGHKYWFHNPSGIKRKLTFDEYIKICDITRGAIGNRLMPVYERSNQVMQMMFAYFNTNFKPEELQLGVGLFTELQMRMKYDPEMLLNLFS